jgi:hypothetical protein
MLHIKRFMDKMAMADTRQNKDLVLPMPDARGLRDEITRLLADLHELNKKHNQEKDSEVVQIEVKGGSFK